MSIYLFANLQKYNALDLRSESVVLNSDETTAARTFMQAGLLDDSKDFSEIDVHFICPPGFNVASAIATMVLLKIDLANVTVVTDEAIDVSATPAVKIMTYDAFAEFTKSVVHKAEDVQFQRLLEQSGDGAGRPIADELEWTDGGDDHV